MLAVPTRRQQTAQVTVVPQRVRVEVAKLGIGHDCLLHRIVERAKDDNTGEAKDRHVGRGQLLAVEKLLSKRYALVRKGARNGKNEDASLFGSQNGGHGMQVGQSLFEDRVARVTPDALTNERRLDLCLT